MLKFTTKKKNLVLVGLLVVLICSLTLFVALSPTFKTSAECSVTTAEPVKSIYLLDEQFSVPTAKLDYNGEEVSATSSYVIFPDGKKYSDSSVTLTEAGKYSVCYSAQKDGKILVGEVYFTVENNLFSVDGDGKAEYKEQVNVYGIDTAQNGIAVTLPIGSTFTYNKILDLSSAKQANNILSLLSTPERELELEVNDFYVKLTDAYDQNNYVVVSNYNYKYRKDDATCYRIFQSANANGQPSTGLLLSNSGGEITYDGGSYNLEINSDLGYLAYFALNGYSNEIYEKVVPYKLSMDYSERIIYGASSANASNGVIIDLDNPLFFNNLWQGFTTGEVYLSIYSKNYVQSTFNFLITDIFGHSLDDKTVVDDVKPLITVDYLGQDKNQIPYAILNQEYTAFNAKAVDDVDGEVKCVSAVYYNYHTNNPINVTLLDGKFTPTMKGVYSIVYYAKDSSGNQNSVVVDVSVLEQSQISVQANTITGELKTGSNIEFSCAVSGNSGMASIKAKATLKSDASIVYELDLENGYYSFVPMYAGEYDVEFTVTDYVTSKTQTKTITVLANDGFYLLSEPSIPYLLVKDVQYKINGLKAYNLKSGKPVIEDAKISLSIDGGNFNELTDNSLKIQSGSKAVIRYSFDQNFYKDYEIDVVDVKYTGNKPEMKNYFHGKHFTSVSNDDGSIYTTSADGAELYFANELLSTNFNFDFKNTSANFTNQVITLTDTVNISNQLKISITKVNDKTCTVIINDAYISYVSLALAKDDIKITYNQSLGFLAINDRPCDVGEFKGFNSKLVRLKMTLNGVSGESSVMISKVNGQKFVSDTGDLLEPAVSYTISNVAPSIDEVITLSDFIVQDVLRFETTFKLTMTDPDGDKCVTVDGVELNGVTDRTAEYKIKITKVGAYRINLNYSDGINVKRVIITLTVENKVAPTITIEDKIEKVDLNDTVTIDDFTVTDDLDQDITASVYVIDSTGKTFLLNDYEYVATEKGVCTVIIKAVDSSGNVATESYTFIVK